LSRVRKAPCHLARCCEAVLPFDRVARWECLAPWPGLLRHLRALGYVEVTDALRRGLITKDEADELLG
jgi:hypothetical protein